MLHQFSKIFLVFFILVGVFFSCTKDDEPTPKDPDPVDTVVVTPPDTTGTGDTTTTGDTVVVPVEPPQPTAITVTGTDYAKYHRVGSTYMGRGLNLARITTAPTEGENQVWDLTGFQSSNPLLYRNFDRISVPDSSSFTSATYRYSYPSVFNSNLTLTEYTEVSDAGHFRVGAVVNPTVLDLGNGVKLTAAGEEIPFTPKDITYTFPMNYRDSYTNNWSVQENYRLTAPPFNLSNAPVSRKLTSEGKIEVAGWGKLILPQAGIADTVEVLLVKDIRRSVINYFLNGATAPNALLSALGLREGETENTITYKFVSKEFGEVAEIRYNVRSNDTAVTPATLAYYIATKTE